MDILVNEKTEEELKTSGTFVMGKIAVVGAMGEIGIALTEYLLNRNEDVRVIHRGAVAPKLARYNLDSRQVNLCDEEATQNALKDCRVVINCAVDRKKYVSPEVQIDRNGVAAQNLISASLKNKITRFIHLSSIVVLPPTIKNFEIENPFHYSKEKDPYSVSKILTEKIVLQHKNKMEICILRPGIVYGPFMAWSKIAFERILAGGIVLPASKNKIFLCHAINIKDLISLIYKTINHQSDLPLLIYGINPEGVSWKEYYEQHAKSIKTKDPIEFIPPFKMRIYQKISFIKKLFARTLSCFLLPNSTKNKLTNALKKLSWILTFHGNKKKGRYVPSAAEWSMYLTEGKFNLKQCGGDIGFLYNVSLVEGVRQAAKWWEAESKSQGFNFLDAS